jgi:cellulose biosynthesis protein BcsQ
MILAVASGKGGTGKTFPVQEKGFELPGRKCVASIMNDPELGSSSSPYLDMVF